MVNSYPPKYWLKSTILIQAGKTVLKHLSWAVKWHDLTSFLKVTVHVPLKGKAKIYSFTDYSFSSEMIQCDFLLVARAVLATQSCPVSSVPSVTASRYCRKVCSILGVGFFFGFFFWWCVCGFFFFFWQTSLSIWDGCERVREFLVLMQNNQLNITDYISSGFSIPGWQQSANPTFILDFINWNKGGWQEKRCRIEEADDGAACGQHTV